MKPDAPGWAFAWTTGKPYITSIIHWTKRQVIAEVEAAHREPWKKIYRQGGRAIRITIREAK